MAHLTLLRDFASPPEGHARTVRIYTPDGYGEDPARRWPVLYMHDGQNVFAHPESALVHTWCANRALESLEAAGQLSPWLVVAVDSGLGRLEEYSPWDEPRAGVRARGPRYARFLVEHLKPWVDRHYRTRPEREWTAVAGSSLGGLVSLYLGWAYPEVYGRVGAFSPSVMWSAGRLFEAWRTRAGHPLRLYLDAGTHEHLDVGSMQLPYGQAARDFHRHLCALGYGEEEVRLVLDPQGEHHERDWQRRLPLALRWLLGAPLSCARSAPAPGAPAARRPSDTPRGW